MDNLHGPGRQITRRRAAVAPKVGWLTDRACQQTSTDRGACWWRRTTPHRPYDSTRLLTGPSPGPASTTGLAQPARREERAKSEGGSASPPQEKRRYLYSAWPGPRPVYQLAAFHRRCPPPPEQPPSQSRPWRTNQKKKVQLGLSSAVDNVSPPPPTRICHTVEVEDRPPITRGLGHRVSHPTPPPSPAA